MLTKLAKEQEIQKAILKEIKEDISRLTKNIESHATTINQLDHYFGQIPTTLNQRHPGTLSINTVQNKKNNGYVLVITTCSGIANVDPALPSMKFP